MRLLDQVVQACAPVEIEDMAGRHRMTGCIERAPAVTACPLRWVLQPNVAQRCRDLLRTDREMLVPENMLLRAPAAQFWLEWMDWGAGRTGLLVNADAEGRRGTVEVFWEHADREPDYAQGTLEFDFAEAIWDRRGEDRYAFEPEAHPLAPHLLLHVHREWLPHLFAKGPVEARRAIEQIACNTVSAAEMLFAFAALMLDRPEIDNRPADLAKLNRSRAAKGKPPLLDHLEVSFNLLGLAAERRREGAVRSGSRLHFVRGHMVRRDGKAFWRRSHLRGDASQPIKTRTVTVR